MRVIHLTVHALVTIHPPPLSCTLNSTTKSSLFFYSRDSAVRVKLPFLPPSPPRHTQGKGEEGPNLHSSGWREKLVQPFSHYREFYRVAYQHFSHRFVLFTYRCLLAPLMSGRRSLSTGYRYLARNIPRVLNHCLDGFLQ